MARLLIFLKWYFLESVNVVGALMEVRLGSWVGAASFRMLLRAGSVVCGAGGGIGKVKPWEQDLKVM